MTNQSLPLGPDAIASLLQCSVKPVFFLGAGASVKSGIPTAGMLVDTIAKFAYCKFNNRNPDDPNLMRSDWIRWLEKQSWFRMDVPTADLYPQAVEHLLLPQSYRKEFFQRIMKPDVPPSDGYSRLSHLLARRLVRTILTTNFDELVVQTAKQTPTIRHIEEIVTHSDHVLFSTNPQHPQIVYLHGSVSHYTDRNLIKETMELDSNLVTLLQPLLRDHPLVVIGYRGTEPSIMKHLLIDQANKCARFRNGIFWCHMPGSNPTSEAPLIAQLQSTIGSNLQLVEIEGFDELLIAVERSVYESAADAWHSTPATPEVPRSTCVNDLQPSSLTLGDINEALLKTKLLEYASTMRLTIPALGTTEQLWAAMFAQNLATSTSNTSNNRFATKGCQLLFARSAEQQAPSAKIRVTVSGPSYWIDEILDPAEKSSSNTNVVEVVITGDLWSQLEQVSNLLSRVNKPFRLKGQVSQTTYPYPPLALKELLTNLLAHRSYEDDKLANLTITPADICFENPGGLVDSVRRQLEHESIQQVVGSGIRRLKGYRNPVIADFFFSAGAMDKEGSGLPDVVQEAANNLNSVEFGPTENNAAFCAIIRCRPETLLVDQDTKTAKPQKGELRYSPNLLRVIAWPETIHKLGTIATPKEISGAENDQSPPIGTYRNWLWTFENLNYTGIQPLLDLCLDEERYIVATTDLLTDRDAGAILPRLLNTALFHYLQKIGLRVRGEGNRLRAYYPSHKGEPREILYKSTFRQSKRTVTKPIVSRKTGDIVYWEHKAVSLRFERFGFSWALSLLPGYIFTIDGDSSQIDSERIGPLSTRRAARDYNPTVMHDLVFWSRMLATGSETDFSIPLSMDDPSIAVVVSPMIQTFVFQETVESGISEANEMRITVDDDLNSLQEEIEKAIEESADQKDNDNEAADI